MKHTQYLTIMIIKFLIALSIPSISILPTLAQDTAYYDANWKVTIFTNASYFRLKNKTALGWQVKDCYLSGIPQMEGSYMDESCTISQSDFKYYDRKGNLYHSCHYENGKLEGAELLYYDNGHIRTEGAYLNGMQDGEWKGYYPSGNLSARANFKDGEQFSASFLNEDGTRNKLVSVFSRTNSYPGGLPALQRFLNRNLHYPDTAVKRSIEGTVIIGFNINREGKMEDLKILQSVEASLDSEAIRVIRLMPHWEPLIIGGIACDSYQKQPILFKLQSE
jgi:periplasmic protein TonB